MTPDQEKFARMQAADQQAERKILRGEIAVLVVLAIIAVLYGLAFG